MEHTSKPATSLCGQELLVPLHVARKANRTKTKGQTKPDTPAPATTAESDSLFL